MINDQAKVVMWTHKNICIESKSCLYRTLHGKRIIKLEDLVEFRVYRSITVRGFSVNEGCRCPTGTVVELINEFDATK